MFGLQAGVVNSSDNNAFTGYELQLSTFYEVVAHEACCGDLRICIIGGEVLHYLGCNGITYRVSISIGQ